MASLLTRESCEACNPRTPILTYPECKRLLKEVPLWEHRHEMGFTFIRRVIRFDRYLDAIMFVSKIAEVAEAKHHHPRIDIREFNQVTLDMTTDAIRNLSRNDFIVAAKIDTIPLLTG